MNSLTSIPTPLRPDEPRRIGVPTAPPPPDLPHDLPGIAAAIEVTLDNGPPARMGQTYYAWFRRLPGVLLGAHEGFVVDLAAVKRTSEVRERTINMLTSELASERGKLVEYLEQLKEAQTELTRLQRRRHPVRYVLRGAAWMLLVVGLAAYHDLVLSIAGRGFLHVWAFMDRLLWGVWG